MDYITAEQFLKQPKEIQGVFKKWLFDGRNLVPVEITETQLRHFIEEKACRKIALIEYDFDHYNMLLSSGKAYITKESDLLQAYWQVACKIAEGD